MVSREFRQVFLYISLSLLLFVYNNNCLQTGFLYSLCIVPAADCGCHVTGPSTCSRQDCAPPAQARVLAGGTGSNSSHMALPREGAGRPPVGAYCDPLRSPRLCGLRPQVESRAVVLPLHLAGGEVYPFMCHHPPLIILMEISNSEYR